MLNLAHNLINSIGNLPKNLKMVYLNNNYLNGESLHNISNIFTNNEAEVIDIAFNKLTCICELKEIITKIPQNLQIRYSGCDDDYNCIYDKDELCSKIKLFTFKTMCKS